MSTLSVGVLVCGIVGSLLSPAPVAAQGVRSLEVMEGHLAAGKEVKFQVRYNSAGGVDAPRATRIYGNYPIYMADGEVSLTRDKIASRATAACEGWAGRLHHVGRN